MDIENRQRFRLFGIKLLDICEMKCFKYFSSSFSHQKFIFYFFFFSFGFNIVINGIENKNSQGIGKLTRAHFVEWKWTKFEMSIHVQLYFSVALESFCYTMYIIPKFSYKIFIAISEDCLDISLLDIYIVAIFKTDTWHTGHIKHIVITKTIIIVVFF